MSLSLSRRKGSLTRLTDPQGRLRDRTTLTDAGALADRRGGYRLCTTYNVGDRREINRGELEILLPSYQSDPRPVYALYTEKDKLPLKVQVCINYLTEYFVDVAKIYQGMHGRGIAR